MAGRSTDSEGRHIGTKRPLVIPKSATKGSHPRVPDKPSGLGSPQQAVGSSNSKNSKSAEMTAHETPKPKQKIALQPPGIHVFSKSKSQGDLDRLGMEKPATRDNRKESFPPGPKSGASESTGDIRKMIKNFNQEVPPSYQETVAHTGPERNRPAIDRREVPELILPPPPNPPVTTPTRSRGHPQKTATDEEQPGRVSKNESAGDGGSEPPGRRPQKVSVDMTGSLNAVSAIKDIFMSDEKRYRKTKKVLAILFGLIFGVFFYFVLYAALDNDWRRALIISAPVVSLVTLGLCFSVRVRCVATLTMPTLCTSEGRGAMYAIVVGLLLSGPIQNIYLNADETANAMSCSYEMAVNHSMELQEATLRVISSYVDVIARGADGLQDSSRTLYDVFSTVEDQLDRLDRGFQEIQDTLQDIASECRDQVGSARTSCSNAVNDAYRSCRSGLRVKRFSFGGAVSDVGGAVGGAVDDGVGAVGGAGGAAGGAAGDAAGDATGAAGDATDAARGASGDVCEALDIDELCEVLNVASVCSLLPVTNVVNLLLTELQKFRDSLRVDVQVTSDWENREDTNGSLRAIRDAVREDLQSTHDVIMKIFEISDKILAFTLLWLVIRSYSYYWKFCTKDKFDNMYITDAFVKLDERRRTDGGQPLLPLKKSEKRHYVELKSYKLSKLEKGLFKVGLLMVFLHATIALLVIVADYGLYWLLMLLQEHGEFRYTLESSGSIDISVGGSGLLSDIIRYMFTDGISSESFYTATIDTAICLPRPSSPSTRNTVIIGVLYAFTLLTVLCQAYMLRLRRSIAAYYYPDRELERAEYLYDKALSRRESLVRRFKNSMEERLREMRRAKSLGLLAVLTKRCPCLGRVLGRLRSHNVHCHGCRDKDHGGEFRRCSDETCDCIYCKECAQEAGGVCACDRPIDGRVGHVTDQC